MSVDCTASAMSGMIADVALFKQHGFVDFGIECIFNACVANIFNPLFEIFNRFLRTVCIIYL
ncbi:hypothetical protein [Methanobrevibacter sp.]|uniref:hypothetical protein n=1 Tax=Methanobrevibacter sp. TaxID=66852 RepID=UPI00345743FC